MTDQPRFEPCEVPPDVAHCAYHGGRLVDFVFRLVDWWQPDTPGGRQRVAAREAVRRAVDVAEPQQAAARLGYLRRRIDGLGA
jgi:hypothetical protein